MFFDRKKDMIQTGGENVASIKVERLLLSNDRIEAAAVVGLPHERWIEAVTAFVVPKKGEKITEEDILAFCKTGLATFEIPKKVVIVDDLPKTTTGKLEKFKLRDKYHDLYKTT